MVRVLRSIAGLRDDLTPLRRDGKSIGLVPTMGALHAGHGSLIERSARENDSTVVSIFVNPAQFDRRDDYATYPRDFEKDVEYCRSRGAGWIFAPAVEEMYPGTGVTFVEAAATVIAAGFIDDGDDKGVKVGDLLIVLDTATPLATVHIVTVVAANGDVTAV